MITQTGIPQKVGCRFCFYLPLLLNQVPCHCEQSIRIQNVLIQEAVANAILRPAQERYVPFLHRIGAIGNIVARLLCPRLLRFAELVAFRYELIVIQIVSCRDRIDRSADGRNALGFGNLLHVRSYEERQLLTGR